MGRVGWGEIIVLSLVGVVVYLVLILPIMLIINCAKSDWDNKKKKKWLMCMILLFPFGTYAYALIYSKKIWLKIASIAGILYCLLYIFSFVRKTMGN